MRPTKSSNKHIKFKNKLEFKLSETNTLQSAIDFVILIIKKILMLIFVFQFSRDKNSEFCQDLQNKKNLDTNMLLVTTSISNV